MPPLLDYRVVDVFTDRPFAGNPLAVVFGADELPGAALGKLAREFNLSDTAFPMAPTGAADYRVRIFTPGTELPFAGHPSVGTAWALAEAGRLTPGEVVQECGAGLLRLQVAADGGPVRLFGAAASARPLVAPERVAAAVGLPAGVAEREPLAAGAGLDFVYLAVAGEALDRLRPDPAAIAELSADERCTGVCVAVLDGERVRSRVLAGGVGVDEDPATGSAALGLGAALVRWGLAGPDAATAYTVAQGEHVGRPSQLRCAVRAQRGAVVEVSVAGDVQPVAEGRIRIP